jgi:hypothetical protein
MRRDQLELLVRLASGVAGAGSEPLGGPACGDVGAREALSAVVARLARLPGPSSGSSRHDAVMAAWLGHLPLIAGIRFSWLTRRSRRSHENPLRSCPASTSS